MTPKVIYAPPHFVAPTAAKAIARWLRTILAVPLVATMLAGSAPDFDIADGSLPHSAAIASTASAGEDGTTAQPQRRSSIPSREIEALVRIVASKYRISQRATREYVRTAFREGARIDVDPLLIVAVMAVESGFDPTAESTAGALGLMQVIPRYHPEKLDASGGRSVLDPETNIQIGALVLKEYIARHGNPVAGLQRYNGSFGDPSSAYAKKVLGEKQWLQQAIRRYQVGVGA